MSHFLDQFKQILKKKGTGKTMSKHMNESDIRFVLDHFLSTDVPLSTKATLLTAWIMLDKTPEEHLGLEQVIQNKATILPKPLHFLFNPNDSTIDHAIHQAIKGNEISSQVIRSVFNEFLVDTLPDYKLASFLEALRLKEETFNENTTIFDIFRAHTNQMELDIPLLLDIATPYDGFNRSYFLQPFVCALLAAAGIPSVIHGVHEVSPKKGMNPHKLL